jgi:hypothetical protein
VGSLSVSVDKDRSAWWCVIHSWLGGVGVVGVFLSGARSDQNKDLNDTCEPLDAIIPDARTVIGDGRLANLTSQWFT